MDKIVEQLGQDLARAGYAESTRKRYVATAKDLARRFGRPLSELSRKSFAFTSTSWLREATVRRGSVRRSRR